MAKIRRLTPSSRLPRRLRRTTKPIASLTTGCRLGPAGSSGNPLHLTLMPRPLHPYGRLMHASAPRPTVTVAATISAVASPLPKGRPMDIDLSEEDLRRIFGQPPKREWDRWRVSTRDARRIPHDSWVRLADESWHVVDEVAGSAFVGACGASVPESRGGFNRAFGRWRSGHWPVGSCSACMQHAQVTKRRVADPPKRSAAEASLLAAIEPHA